MSEIPPPKKPEDIHSSKADPNAKNSKILQLAMVQKRNPDESESDISNTRSINVEGSGFDADGELSDITVRERKKRERKIVRNVSTKKKRSPTGKKISTPKKGKNGSDSKAT